MLIARSSSVTPASLEALSTFFLSSAAGIVSTPCLEMISSTALLTAIHDHAAIMPEYAT